MLAIVLKDLDTLKGIQTELTKLTGDISVISPEKVKEFEKAVLDLLNSETYKAENGVNVRVAASDLLEEIYKDPNPVAAYDKRRENLEALLTRVAAFVGEMKTMAEAAKKSAKDEIIEANRKRLADEARLATEKAETDRKAREAAQLAAARAVVAGSVTPPVRDATPRPLDASASVSVSQERGGEVTQADAGMRFTPPAEPRRDAERPRTAPEVQTSPTVVIAPKDMLTALANGAPDSVRTLVSEALSRCSEKVQFTLTPELVKQVLSQGAIGELLNRELAKNNLSDLDISELKLQKEKRGDSLILSGIKAVAREQGLPIQLNLSVEIALVNGLPEIRAIKHSGNILMQGIVNNQLQAKINEKGGLKDINARLTQDGIRSALESQGISGDRVSIALDSSGNPVISLHKAQKPPPPTGGTPAPRQPSSPPPANLQSAPHQDDSDAGPHVSEQGPDRRTTQANAGMAFTQPDEQRRDEQRPDGQGLEANDNRKAAETAAAVEKAREKEQEKERVMTLMNEQMKVLKGLHVELDNFHKTIRTLSIYFDDKFSELVFQLLKERKYSYYEQNGNGNMVVQKLLTQIQSAADPVAEYATYKDPIESYVAKVVSLTTEVRRMAEDFLKKAQVEKEREDAKAAEEKRKAEAAAAELAKKNAEVDEWLKRIDDSIETFKREYTAIDGDMKANFPSIYDGFKDGVNRINQSPIYHSGQDYTLDVLERARQAARKASDRFEEYSVRKDSVADCLEKDTKRLAAIKELADRMKREATSKAQAEADAKRRANEETEAAAAAELTRKNAEVDQWLKGIDASLKKYEDEYKVIFEDMIDHFPDIKTEFFKRIKELGNKDEYLFDRRDTLNVLELARKTVRDAPDRVVEYTAWKETVTQCLEKDARLLAAVKALAEEMKRAETATREAKAIQDTVAAASKIAQAETRKKEAPVEAQALTDTREAAIKLGLEDAQRQKAADLARAAEQPAENRAVVPYVEPDRRVTTVQSRKQPTGEAPRTKERGDNSTPLPLAAPKGTEQKGEGESPIASADARINVGEVAPAQELDPAKAARIRQLEAKIALEKSIINSPTSSEERRKYAQRDLDPLEREYRILTHTASHEDWVDEVAKLNEKIDKLAATEQEIHNILSYEKRPFIKEQQESRLRKNSEEQHQLIQDLREAEKQVLLTAPAENRVATSSPLPEATADGTQPAEKAPIFTDQEKELIQQYEDSLTALSAKLEKPDVIGEYSQEYQNAKAFIQILSQEEEFSDESEHVRMRLKEILAKLKESLALADTHDREVARKKRVTGFPGTTPGYVDVEDAEQELHGGIEGSGRKMTIGGKEIFVKSFDVGEGGRINHTKNLMALAQTQKRFYTAAQTALGSGSVAHSDIAIGQSQLNYKESDDVYGANNKVNTFSEYLPEEVKDTLRTSEENKNNSTRELSDEGKYVRRLALRYPSSSSDKEAIDIRNRNRELLASQRDALARYLQALRLGSLVGYLPDIQMQTGYFNKRVDCLIIMNHNIRLTQDGVVKLIDYGYPRLNVLSPSQMERLRARILQKEQGGEAAYTYDQASKKYNFAPWYTEALNAAFKADFEAYAQDKNGTKKLGFGDSKTQIQPAHVDPRTGQSFSPSIALGHNKIDRAQDFASADEYAANMSQILLASLTQETIRDDADQYSGYLGNIEASKALLTDALDGNEQNMQTSGAGGHTPLPEAVRGADARAGNESSKLAREQKNCARFVDEWKKYVDEQISALAALIPQAQAAMSEANLNTFREIVKEYNTALEIIDDERKKKAMVPGWEGLATAFPSDGTSGSAARFAELKTQFEQLHLQESLNYTYAVTIFKQKYIDGVASYLLELRIFSAALGRISLEGVTSRPALEQSRDQAVTDKLRKVIEMSGYGTDTVGKLATYADLYKSLSAPNSGVSHALVEPQLPVITDALGTTYQTLIVETIESAIAPTGYKTISDAIDRLREFKESVATKTGWVKIYINEFNRIPGALTKIATAASLITDPSLREVITKGNKTSDYESLAQAAELYAGIRSALDQSAKVDRSTAIGAEARVDTRVAESAPQAAQVEGFVPYLGSTRTLAEAVRTKRENDRSPRVAYLEYYQKHPEKIVSFEGTVYLLGRTFDTGVNGRVFEAFVATDEQQAAMRESMGNAYNPSVIDESWIKANTPDQFINDQGVITVAGKQLMRDSSMPDFGAAHPEHVALKFKRKSTSLIGGQVGGGDAESFKREMQAFQAFEGNKTLADHTPHLHGAFHERFKDQAIAMSWIDGELGMSGPVSEDEVLRFADELLSMIDASEQTGCPLGQDNLKPGSVAIGPDGQVQMIDLDTDSYVGRNKNLAHTLTTLIAGSDVSYGMSELLSRISGLEDLRSANARRAQIQEIHAAIAEYRALRSLDVPTLTAQMNDPAASNSRRLAAFELLSEKMKGKVSPEQATMASQLYFDQSVNTTMSRKERDLSQSLGSTRFPADMRYLILPHIPLTETQAVQNTKDGNLDKLAEQFPANRELQALIAAVRMLSKATTQTGYRERERELKAYAYELVDAYKDIPGSTLAGASEWFAKLIPYSRAKGREGMLSTARVIIGQYDIYPIYRYGLADLTGNIMPAKKIEVVQEEYPDTTKIDLKPIKDGGCIVDSITYPRNSTDRPELTISNGWVSTRFVDANMTLEPSVPWSSIDKLVAKDSRITLKGGQGRHVDSWIDGAIRIAAPPEKTESSTQLFVRSVKIHEQYVPEGAKSAPVRLDIEDAAAKVLVGVGSEDIACDHKDQLYILDKSAFGEQYKINIPADYKEDSITFPAQSAEGNKKANVVFVRRKIGSREEWLFSHFVDEDSKSDGKGDENREKKTEQFGQKTIDEANGLLESWTNFTQSQKTENPTLSFESDSRLLRSAISNLLNARARGQDLVKLSGLLDALEAQIPISRQKLEAAKANPVAYANAEADSIAQLKAAADEKNKPQEPAQVTPESVRQLVADIRAKIAGLEGNYDSFNTLTTLLDGLDQAADPVAHYQSIQAQVEAELRILEPRLGHFRAVEAQLKQDEADDDVRKSIMAKWEGRDGIPTDQDIMQMTENELIYFLPEDMTRYLDSNRESRESALSVRKTILGHDADYKYDGKTRILFVRIFFNDKQSKTFTMNY